MSDEMIFDPVTRAKLAIDAIDSMLAAITGEAFQAFEMHDSGVREAYLYALSERSSELKAIIDAM